MRKHLRNAKFHSVYNTIPSNQQKLQTVPKSITSMLPPGNWYNFADSRKIPIPSRNPFAPPARDIWCQSNDIINAIAAHVVMPIKNLNFDQGHSWDSLLTIQGAYRSLNFVFAMPWVALACARLSTGTVLTIKNVWTKFLWLSMTEQISWNLEAHQLLIVVQKSNGEVLGYRINDVNLHGIEANSSST